MVGGGRQTGACQSHRSTDYYGLGIMSAIDYHVLNLRLLEILNEVRDPGFRRFRANFCKYSSCATITHGITQVVFGPRNATPFMTARPSQSSAFSTGDRRKRSRAAIGMVCIPF